MPLGAVIGPHERELWLVLRPQCVLPCGHWAPVGPTPTACSNPEQVRLANPKTQCHVGE